MLFFKGEVGSKNQKYLLQFNTLNVAINYSYIAGGYKYLKICFKIQKVESSHITFQNYIKDTNRNKTY